MIAIEPDTSAVDCHETQIIIQVPNYYKEIVEVHRSMETGSVFVQIILVNSLTN